MIIIIFFHFEHNNEFLIYLYWDKNRFKLEDYIKIHIINLLLTIPNSAESIANKVRQSIQDIIFCDVTSDEPLSQK